MNHITRIFILFTCIAVLVPATTYSVNWPTWFCCGCGDDDVVDDDVVMDRVITENEFGQTPLMLEIMNILADNDTIIRNLIETCPDLEAADQDGNTALMYAVMFSNKYAFDLLIDKEANANAHNNSRMNVFQLAVQSKRKIETLIHISRMLNIDERDTRTMVNQQHHQIMLKMLTDNQSNQCPTCMKLFDRKKTPEFLFGCTEEQDSFLGKNRILRSLNCIICYDCLNNLVTKSESAQSNVITCPKCSKNTSLLFAKSILNSSVRSRRDSVTERHP